MKTKTIMSIELECEEKELINKVWELLDSIGYKMHAANIKEIEISDTNFDLESLNKIAELLYDML